MSTPSSIAQTTPARSRKRVLGGLLAAKRILRDTVIAIALEEQRMHYLLRMSTNHYRNPKQGILTTTCVYFVIQTWNGSLTKERCTLYTEHTDVVAVYQNYATTVTTGRAWAIVREIRHPRHPLVTQPPYGRECVLAPGQESDALFDLDLDLILDVTYSYSYRSVGRLEQYPHLAKVSQTVAEVLCQAPLTT